MRSHSPVASKARWRALTADTLTLVLLGLTLILAVQVTQAADPCAVWDYRYWSCRVDGDKVDLERRYRITVQNAAGEKHAKAWYVEDRFRKLKKVEITVRDNSGRAIRVLEKDDLERQCGFGAGFQLYSDVCHYDYRPSVSTYPVSIEYVVRQRFESPFFLRGVQVQQSIPVNQAECSLRYDDKRPVSFRSYGLGSPQVDTTDSERLMVWRFDSLPAIDTDTIASREVMLAGSIMFRASEFKFAGAKFEDGGWREIARWYAALAESRYDEKAEGAMLTDDSMSELDLVRALYDQTREENRYVSVSIGTSGWRPRKASSVVKTRYGDCKDLSTLLVSRLRSAGIEAGPALILTRNEGYLDTEFPSFGFNHVIATAVVDSDTIWMDPTCSLCPLGQLPWTDQATHALMVDDSGGRFVPTAVSSANDNLAIRRVNLAVGPDRLCRIDAHIALSGHEALSYRQSLVHMDNEEIEQLFVRSLAGGAASWTLAEVTIDGLEDAYSPLEVALRAESRRPCRELQGVMYVDARVFDPGGKYGGQELLDRTRSVRLLYPNKTIDTVWVSFDSSVTYDSVVIPDATYDSAGFARSWLERASEGETIGVIHGEAYDSLEICADQFDALNEFETRLLDRNRMLIKVYRR